MQEHRLALPSGYQLDHFCLESVLGKGGFGITYLAVDLRLGKKVAIKELLPDSIATRVEGYTVVPQSSALGENWQWARQRFLEEAKVLAGFSHPAIVGVHLLLEAHGTVYMVMDYVKGESYEARLRRIGREADEASLMSVMGPILDGLAEVHAKGLLHRDIKPENILINARGNPVLIDFGSARESVGKTMTMTSIVTHGYSPIEQYQTKGRMGPWTDIYAMGAVMCRAMTGEKPPVAADRIDEDEFDWLSYRDLRKFSENFKQAVDWALRVKVQERPKSVAEFRDHLVSGGQAPASKTAPEAKAKPEPPVVSEPPPQEVLPRGPEPPAAKPSRPRWLTPAIAAAVFALLLASAVGLFVVSQTAKSSEPRADVAAADQKKNEADALAAKATQDQTEHEERAAKAKKDAEEKGEAIKEWSNEVALVRRGVDSGAVGSGHSRRRLANAEKLYLAMLTAAIDSITMGNKAIGWPADVKLTTASQVKRMLIDNRYLRQDKLTDIYFDEFLIGNVSEEDGGDTIALKSKSSPRVIITKRGIASEIHEGTGQSAVDPPRSPAYLRE